ncbi:hypothetical protein FEM33_23285 [Dyadobacter flavalbus]|uniref:Poly(3-hydroxyalkanoate) polymerase subunit PhaE n=1 Tax=Dyadobacter flavalbus TaxID=2579942 RepID=A0A5M8Q9P9_9BACT|nr:poly(R)-hydroxyalkanoic acid synthase subunit PhaE [Dyadobacter flavalbus]KAA6432649.1 hypothetical protein FEM33_23285 [Dyadobacter flavalbus]
MEQRESVFDAWYKNTTNLVDGWKHMANEWSDGQSTSWENMQKVQKQWMQGYQSMMENMTTGNFGNAYNPFGSNQMRDAFSNMLKSVDIYTRLFALWQPVLKQMEQMPFDHKDMWKMIDPEAFRSFVDKLFGVDQGTIMKGYYEQYGKLMKMWMATMGDAGSSFGPMAGNAMPFFSGMAQMNPEGMMQFYGSLFQTAQKGFTPYFAQTSNGSAHYSESFSKLAGLWSDYVTKMSQMQSMLYKTSVSAWEKVMQSVSEKSQTDHSAKSFDEFYNEWATINEREYVTLFATEAYAALQGELLKLHAEISKTYDKQMESFLQPFPVVLKSQLEEVYQVNHELRNRISELERLITELQQEVKSNQKVKKEQ